MIYIGDFQEVLSSIPDNSVQLILTDPPYPKRYLPEWSKLAKFARAKLTETGILVTYSGQAHLPEVMSRLGKELTYLWTGCLYHGGSRSQLGSNVSSAWKPILYYAKNKHGRNINDYIVSNQQEKDLHPWQQSKGASRFIEKYTIKGDLVVDPFAGSGNFVKWAEELGRIGIGADLCFPAEFKR
jgi:DNA modification methylase